MTSAARYVGESAKRVRAAGAAADVGDELGSSCTGILATSGGSFQRKKPIIGMNADERNRTAASSSDPRSSRILLPEMRKQKEPIRLDRLFLCNGARRRLLKATSSPFALVEVPS